MAGPKYYPILKWKKGEQDAVRYLDAVDQGLMLPILEVIDKPDSDANADRPAWAPVVVNVNKPKMPLSRAGGRLGNASPPSLPPALLTTLALRSFPGFGSSTLRQRRAVQDRVTGLPTNHFINQTFAPLVGGREAGNAALSNGTWQLGRGCRYSRRKELLQMVRKDSEFTCQYRTRHYIDHVVRRATLIALKLKTAFQASLRRSPEKE